MGRAGKALRQTLESHHISQNKLAVALGIPRSVVYHWFHEHVDPGGETIAGIVQAINRLSPAAAEQFVQLYLGDLVGDVPPDES